jgi:hypothetical protein
MLQRAPLTFQRNMGVGGKLYGLKPLCVKEGIWVLPKVKIFRQGWRLHNSIAAVTSLTSLAYANERLEGGL